MEWRGVIRFGNTLSGSCWYLEGQNGFGKRRKEKCTDGREYSTHLALHVIVTEILVLQLRLVVFKGEIARVLLCA
jgi:hypothetical protein